MSRSSSRVSRSRSRPRLSISASADDLGGRLAAKDAMVAKLRGHNQALEGTLLAERDRTFLLRKDQQRLQRRTKEQTYMGRMLRQEQRTVREQNLQLESLKNVVEWSDVSKRHDVEQTIADKTEEVEYLRARLATVEQEKATHRSQAQKLSARVSMLEEIAQNRALQNEEAIDAVRADLGAQLEVSDRNAEMLTKQGKTYEEMLRRMGKDLVRASERNQKLQQKLGNVNIMLVGSAVSSRPAQPTARTVVIAALLHCLYDTAVLDCGRTGTAVLHRHRSYNEWSRSSARKC